MPRIDFSTVDDVLSFLPIPTGEYNCRLVDIEIDRTRAGDEMWRLRLRVEEGEFSGRLLFDNLVFSQKALPRVKLVCDCCGLSVEGVLDLTPSMLLEKCVTASTYQETYFDEEGREKVRNTIRFDGYSSPQVTDNANPF